MCEPRFSRWMLAVLVLCCAQAGAQELSRQVVEQLRRSVVFLAMADRQGTGFVISRKENVGVIATNAHVVLGRNGQPLPVKVVFHSGTPQSLELDGKVIASDLSNDLAFVEVRGADITEPLKLAAAPDLHETQNVVLAGFPFGEVLAIANNRPQLTISKGAISSLRRWKLGTPAAIQIDASVNSGNSGGPLVDTNGQVIGVMTLKLSGTQLAFASPISELKEAMRGAVSDLRISQLVEDPNQFQLKFECLFVDPFDNIRDVSLRYLDASVLASDLSKFDTWPLLDSFHTSPPGKIENQRLLVSATIDRKRIPDNKLYVQFVCTRKDGSVHHSRVVGAAIESAMARNRTIPNTTSRPKIDDIAAATTAIDTGPLPVSASSFRRKQVSTGPAAPTPGHTNGVRNAIYQVRIVPKARRTPNEIQIGLLSVPSNSLFSEPLRNDRWLVRRALIPSVEMVENVVWSDRERRLMVLSRTGILYELDADSGKLIRQLKLNGDYSYFAGTNAALVACDSRLRELVILDLQTGKPRQVIGVPPIASVRCTRNASLAFITSGNAPWSLLHICNLESGAYVGPLRFQLQDSSNTSIESFLPMADGSAVFAANADRILRFEVDGGQLRHQSSFEVSRQSGEPFRVGNLCCSDDGAELAVLLRSRESAPLGQLVVLNARNLNLLATYSLSSDSPTVAAKGSGQANWFVGGELQQLWSLTPGRDPENVILPSIAGKTKAIAVANDASTVAVLNDDGLFLIDRK